MAHESVVSKRDRVEKKKESEVCEIMKIQKIGKYKIICNAEYVRIDKEAIVKDEIAREMCGVLLPEGVCFLDHPTYFFSPSAAVASMGTEAEIEASVEAFSTPLLSPASLILSDAALLSPEAPSAALVFLTFL